MATYTSQMFLLLEADSKDIHFKKFKMIEKKYPQLFSVKLSNKAYEDFLRVGALGVFKEKPEGNPISFDDPVQGTQVRQTHAVYALGYRVSREMRDDDQHGIMAQMPADLGESAADHRERLAWDVLNDAYTGTRHTGLENEVLFSATHTRIKAGGTASNILVPPAALSQTALEGITLLADAMTSDEGRFINQQMKLLVIHPNNQFNAQVLLETQYKPGSNNHDINTVAASRNGWKTLEVPYLSSTTRWSVHAAPGSNGLHWFDRNELEFSSAPDADTMDMKYYSSYRASAGFAEFRNSYGSGAL